MFFICLYLLEHRQTYINNKSVIILKETTNSTPDNQRITNNVARIESGWVALELQCIVVLY
jgi:hypothetical protein